jgi:hypothetical protein
MPISGRHFDPTILSELALHIEILFVDQPRDSQRLLDYLKRNKSRVFNHTNPEEFEKMKKFAEKVLNVLYTHVPGLLKNETFFVRAFP